MLTRNCETKSKLIYPGDFNVRLTVCTSKSRYLTEGAYYPAWIETIRDSLGGSILNSSEIKTFSVRRIDKDSSYLFHLQGKMLVERLKGFFQKPVSFRLETLEERPRAWVFLLEKDL